MQTTVLYKVRRFNGLTIKERIVSVTARYWGLDNDFDGARSHEGGQ